MFHNISKFTYQHFSGVFHISVSRFVGFSAGFLKIIAPGMGF